MDGLVGNLVTTTEEIDFMGVAMRWVNVAQKFSFVASRDCEAKMARRTFVQCVVARAKESWAPRSLRNLRSNTNFLYPAVLLVASKQVSSRFVASFVESWARRTRLPGGSEEKQCQQL